MKQKLHHKGHQIMLPVSSHEIFICLQCHIRSSSKNGFEPHQRLIDNEGKKTRATHNVAPRSRSCCPGSRSFRPHQSPQHKSRKLCRPRRGVWCGVWCVVCGVWRVACGVWCVVRGAWRVACGAWCVACSAWCVVRGAWCVVSVFPLPLSLCLSLPLSLPSCFPLSGSWSGSGSGSFTFLRDYDGQCSALPSSPAHGSTHRTETPRDQTAHLPVFLSIFAPPT